MRRQILFVSCILLSFAGPAFAQGPGDPIAEHLFSPELIMKNQREIGLAEGQEKTIKEAIQRTQAKFLEMQWQMQGEAGSLIQLLKARPVDEGAVLAQIDRVLDLERNIKRAQISLLIRIKNTLSDQQIARLTELKGRGL